MPQSSLRMSASPARRLTLVLVAVVAAFAAIAMIYAMLSWWASDRPGQVPVAAHGEGTAVSWNGAGAEAAPSTAPAQPR